MTVNHFQNEYYDKALSNRYQQLICTHLDAILDARYKLTGGQQLLGAKEKLRPVECDDIMLKLRTLLNSVRNFEELLKDNAKLPYGEASKRYKIFVSLNYTEEHIKQVIPLLSSFRSVCLESSTETYELLEEIRHKVDTLLRISEILEPEAKELLPKTLTSNAVTLIEQAHYANYAN